MPDLTPEERDEIVELLRESAEGDSWTAEYRDRIRTLASRVAELGTVAVLPEGWGIRPPDPGGDTWLLSGPWGLICGLTPQEIAAGAATALEALAARVRGGSGG